jgi:uncharacterized oxidoreductase
MIRIEAKALETYVAAIFAALGCPRAEAEAVGLYLTRSNLMGHDSHGVVRVPVYARWFEEGALHPGRAPKIVSETPILAVVDGQYGFGQTNGPFATRLGIEKAKANGLSAVSLRRSGHVGRIGDFAEMAAEAGLVSIHFVTASGTVITAPFGGVSRRFSTAPYCVGVPRQGQEPVVLDFATSMVAEGKCLVASYGGKPLPEGALVTPDGELSTDPFHIYGESARGEGARMYREGKGAIRAFGDHKGSGLALMCELLGGSLTGTGATEDGKTFSNGMFSLFVDPERFDVGDVFDADVKRYVDFVKSSTPMKGVDEVLTPGEPERRARAERLKNGVPLPQDAWETIKATGRKYGLAESAAPAPL